MTRVAQLLHTGARAARDRARGVLAEDRVRRLGMRELRRRAAQPSGTAGEGAVPSSLDARVPAARRPVDEDGALEPRTSSGPTSRAVLRVTGEVDLATAPALAAALRSRLEAAEPGTELDVDLAAVSFIDARGLAVLLEAAATARAHAVGFRVVGRPACLVQLMAITDTAGALGGG